MRDEKDRGSKWMLGRYGNRILTGLGGLTERIQEWKSLQSEVVQPKQLPDGILEVKFAGHKERDRFLIEIATYPEKRVSEQMMRDTALLFLDQHRLPEVLTLVLCPYGKQTVSGAETHRSRLGWTSWTLNWRVVNLWEVPAERLLALDDVGLVPWVPLTKFEGPAETMLNECRRRIKEKAEPKDVGSLLAVTQVLGRLRFDHAMLAEIFRETRVMIESPFIKELLEDPEVVKRSPVYQQARTEIRHACSELQEAIRHVLTNRFRRIPKDLTAAIKKIDTLEQLTPLVVWAAECPSLADFRSRLPS
jgi:hypothetical protein